MDRNTFILFLVVVVVLTATAPFVDAQNEPIALQPSNSNSNNNNNNNNNSPSPSSKPSKTSNSDTPSGSSDPSPSSSPTSDSNNGQPGRIVMKTPPRSVESPLFEIASVVKLKWDYDDNMKQPPSKITIRGQMPDGFHQPGTTKPLYWYIAQNTTASDMAYKWNTVTESPPGYTLREGTGYKLYIYDSDIGWKNSTHVYPGKLFQYMLPFSMYNSRYSRTNDGVPKTYNPNAAVPSCQYSGTTLWMSLLVSTMIVISFVCV